MTMTKCKLTEYEREAMAFAFGQDRGTFDKEATPQQIRAAIRILAKTYQSVNEKASEGLHERCGHYVGALKFALIRNEEMQGGNPMTLPLAAIARDVERRRPGTMPKPMVFDSEYIYVGAGIVRLHNDLAECVLCWAMTRALHEAERCPQFDDDDGLCINDVDEATTHRHGSLCFSDEGSLLAQLHAAFAKVFPLGGATT